MAFLISPNLPANVVEIGNELSQARLDAINNGVSPTSANPFTTVSYISGLGYLTTATASATYAPKASPTFTGVVTIPAGASISGYLTTSSASATYQTIAGMSSYLTDAPSNGSEYVRKNGAWSVATGGGGGITDAPNDGFSYVRNSGGWTQFTGITEAPNDGYYYVRNMSGWYNITGLGFITSSALTVTNIDLTGNFNGYSMGSGWYTFKFDSSTNTLRMQDGTGSGVTVSATGITFPDSTTLSTAPNIAKSVNTQTGNYTLSAADTNNIVYVPYGSGGGMSVDIIVPEDVTYNFAVGTVITLCYDAGGMTGINFSTTGAGSPTLIGNTGAISGGSTGQRILTKLASNFWLIS